jgi:phosphoribosylanthranilate isomerase
VTKVKICGITNLEDARAALDSGADALGFVFAEEAKKRGRYIAPDDAFEIIAQLPPFVSTVAVVVNARLDQLAQWLSYVDLIQFHGEEEPENIPLNQVSIKAFRATPELSIEHLQRYETRAWLIDAHVPGERGGTGAVADWDFAKRAVDAGRPVILAGGLTPENVADAVRAVRPYAVDVSGGVEAAPGKKDHERIRQFIHHVREASLS